MPHIILTGATGLIGKKIFTALRRRGDAVTVLTRHPDRAREQLGRETDALLWSPGMPGAWSAALDGADAVVHLAGESVGASRWNAEVKRRILDSRVQGARALVGGILAASTRPRVLVSMSGVGYYGDCGDTSRREDADGGTDFFARVCVAWEHEAYEAQAAGLRVVTPRTGVVLSKDGGALPRLLQPFRFYAGGPFGHGRQWFPWVHIDDAVAAILHVLDNETVHGPINLVAPEQVRNRDFMRMLGAVLHRPARFPIPGFVLRLVAGEFASALLGGQRLSPDTLVASGFIFRYPGLRQALDAELG